MKPYAAFLLIIFATAAWADSSPVLRVHLPRTAKVKGEAINLKQVAVLFCEDEALIQKAEAVSLGRAPWTGEALSLDRRTISSRLVSEGISSSQFNITGSDAVSVMRDEQLISSEELIEQADAFLTRNRPGPQGASWRLIQRPSPLALKYPAENVKFHTTLSEESSEEAAKVIIAVTNGTQELGKTELLFRYVYPVRQAVSISNIRPGELLTDRNTRIEILPAEHRTKNEWVSPLGKVAAYAIPAGNVISPGQVKDPSSEIIVRRNQMVKMKVEGMGFVVTGLGQALQDGRMGELIKVRNVDSKRIITAEVTYDGTVCPVSEQ